MVKKNSMSRKNLRKLEGRLKVIVQSGISLHATVVLLNAEGFRRSGERRLTKTYIRHMMYRLRLHKGQMKLFDSEPEPVTEADFFNQNQLEEDEITDGRVRIERKKEINFSDTAGLILLLSLIGWLFVVLYKEFFS